jgi:hypothetical protein
MHKIQTITLEDRMFNSGFRVLTEDLKSLGLRRNPNIIQYPFRKWYFLPTSQIQKGPDDRGGIWVTRTLSDAEKLVKYMKEKHEIKTRLFKAAIDEILYINSYRIKTNGIYLLEELRD